MSASLEITYAAHTATCTFLLDSEGICRRIVVASNSSKRRDAARAAARCVGAQYVASLDSTVSGMLTEMPRVGGSMLFARVDERGRVSLVRTGVVTRFESNREEEDPFRETDKVPSMSVETSAPEIAPSPAAPSTPRRSSRRELPEIPQDPYSEEDASDRTQPFQALSPNDFRRMRHTHGSNASIDHEEEDPLDATSEYRSEPQPSIQRRATWPSPGNEPRELIPPPPRSSGVSSSRTGGGVPPTQTLRQPPAGMIAPLSDENDPYAMQTQRRSDPPPPPPPPAYVAPPPQRIRSAAVSSSRGTGTDPGRTPRAAGGYPEKVALRRRGDR